MPLLALLLVGLLGACTVNDPVDLIPPATRVQLQTEGGGQTGGPVSVDSMLARVRAQDAQPMRLELSFRADGVDLTDAQKSELAAAVGTAFAEGERSAPRILVGVEGADDRIAALGLAQRRGLAVEAALPPEQQPAELVYQPTVRAGTVIVEFSRPS